MAKGDEVREESHIIDTIRTERKERERASINALIQEHHKIKTDRLSVRL